MICKLSIAVLIVKYLFWPFHDNNLRSGSNAKKWDRNVCNFNLINSKNHDITIWNVSDPINPMEQGYSSNGNNFSFVCTTDTLMEHCVCPDNDFYTPSFIGKVENQNLHSRF